MMLLPRSGFSSAHISCLGLARVGCAVCWGLGVRAHGSVCVCVTRRAGELAESLPRDKQTYQVRGRWILPWAEIRVDLGWMIKQGMK